MLDNFVMKHFVLALPPPFFLCIDLPGTGPPPFAMSARGLASDGHQIASSCCRPRVPESQVLRYNASDMAFIGETRLQQWSIFCKACGEDKMAYLQQLPRQGSVLWHHRHCSAQSRALLAVRKARVRRRLAVSFQSSSVKKARVWCHTAVSS